MVKKAVRRTTGEVVAVKVVDKRKAAMTGAVADVDAQLRSEVDVLKQLKHECVPLGGGGGCPPVGKGKGDRGRGAGGACVGLRGAVPCRTVGHCVTVAPAPLLSTVPCSNIVGLLDVFDTQRYFYIVLELYVAQPVPSPPPAAPPLPTRALTPPPCHTPNDCPA